MNQLLESQIEEVSEKIYRIISGSDVVQNVRISDIESNLEQLYEIITRYGSREQQELFQQIIDRLLEKESEV